MRILLVIDHLGVGGAQRQLSNLALALKRSGQSVDVFVYHSAVDFEQEMNLEGIKVIKCIKRYRYSPNVVASLAQRLRAGAYDIALSYLDTPNLYLELASLTCRSTRIVASERSAFGPGALSLWKRLQENFHKFSDHIVVNSFAHARRLLKEFDWLKGRVSVIYNGVDGALFKIPPRSTIEGALKLLAVATVVPQKNALNLALALGNCVRDGLDVHVAWAGRHPSDSLAYVETINRTLRKLGAQEHWTWLGERRDVPTLLSEADALIHPSRLEGMPNSVCEALAAARPVLASDFGDLPLLVEDGKSGFLFDPEDIVGIGNAIKRLSNATSENRQMFGLSGRATAAATLSIESCSAQYLDLFRHLTRS